MLNNHTKNSLGYILKSLMNEQSLSMRKLSQFTGINTATISRVINGKQRAKPEHLQRFANFFQIPMKQLMEAAGFEMDNKKESVDIHSSIKIIQEDLEFPNLVDQQSIIPRIKQELEIYERYAQTEEGKQIINEKFEIKAKQVDGMGPFFEHLMQMFSRYSGENVSEHEKAILGSVLLYFILSTDIIPDYLFPVGYLDDALAIKIGLERIQQL